jgi:hypothetical protein
MKDLLNKFKNQTKGSRRRRTGLALLNAEDSEYIRGEFIVMS